MRSHQLLPVLQDLPTSAESHDTSARDQLSKILSMDRAMYAAEFTSAASLGLWAIFDQTNVDDTLKAAYEAQYPGLAADHSLYEHWQEMINRGPESAQGFIEGLKGKVAELDAAEQLENAGYTSVSLSESATQTGWDISAIDPGGQEVLLQVKARGAEYAGELQSLMAENPDIHFAVSTELYDALQDAGADVTDRLIDIGSELNLVESVTEGLGILADNLGLDIPDSVGEIVPYAGIIIAAARLIAGAIKTENEFAAADRTTKNKIQVVQALTLMSRMGINTVMATAGATAGTTIGSIVPGAGNLVGGLVGTIGGAGLGMYLNQQLQPHMLELALNITGLANDDLFYYKNKARIEDTALNYVFIRNELAALPSP